MSQKSKILLIDNTIYISQEIHPPDQYNIVFSSCDHCDCHVSGLNTGHCLAMDNEKNVPCGPFMCFKKLPRGL